jgi:siderophore synthetase component
MPISQAPSPTGPAAPAEPPPDLPSADHAVAHTLLNCLLREVSGPEHETVADDGHLLLRLPRCQTVLRVGLRRASLLGAHRFTGPVARQRQREGEREWEEVNGRQLAELVHAELSSRTAVRNDEFLAQVAASHEGVALALERHLRADHPQPACRYLESEQSLIFGHRFHPAPKARGADREAWACYAPEARTSFPLRYLAVRNDLVMQESAAPDATAPLDRLRPAPDGYTLLPAHPWQYRILRGHPELRAALDRGDIHDLGTGGPLFAPTASVRTLYGEGAFLKFSLNVRITNCLRKNAAYELSGAVALTHVLAPVLDDLADRFPGHAVLREPAYRSVDIHGDTALLEGLGVIVRDGLDNRVPPGTTPLLAAAVADEYPVSSAHLSRLLDGADAPAALRWWDAYLRLLVPPVLAAYFDHGVVFEPHLQNVLLCVDAAGHPVRVLLRDLEGTKLLPGHHAATLADLPPSVAGPMTYDPEHGWDRVVYCMLVNTVAETLAALADLYPGLEPALWESVRSVLCDHAGRHGRPPRLSALLGGVPLPAKANLLTRWERRADRDARYVRIPSPLPQGVLTGAAGSGGWSGR